MSNVHGGSTDGTYGPTLPGAGTTNHYGAYRLKDGLYVDILLSNETGADVKLTSIVFDIQAFHVGSPNNVTLTYVGGGLAGVASNTLVNSTIISDNQGAEGDYLDFDWSISGLASQTVPDGSNVVFRITASGGVGGPKATGLDNVGFVAEGTTSSGVDLRAYQASEGAYVEFVAYDVEEDGTIRLALLGEDGISVWTGSADVLAGPRFIARILVPGLVAGESYDFAVTDEVGQGWAAPNVVVGTFETEMTSLSRTSVALSFDSLSEREYEIQWIAELGGTWQTLYTITAIGNRTGLVVEYPNPEDPSGFFRVQLK